MIYFSGSVGWLLSNMGVVPYSESDRSLALDGL